MTWGRKTGGRKKGTPNKIKKPPALMAEAQAEVAAAVSANEGLQPLDYMLAVMRDPSASEARRDMMAKAAAPYRHPQLQAVAASDLMPPRKELALDWTQIAEGWHSLGLDVASHHRCGPPGGAREKN